ncbi:MAG: hypothetical protein HDR51_03105 [Treponema sp.]|nr:hypothetical protein [Treponema sp.]
MTRAEELKAIKDAVIAGGYSDGEFEKFKDEYGWADWMSDYTEAEEDEPMSESEIKVVDEILQEGFRMAFENN